MVYNDETDVYIRMVYCLVDSKTSCCYQHCCHPVLVLTETKFEPSVIVIDFEAAPIKATKEQFRSR
ncbi:hypothetical protein MXB_1945 [Myxobolus squamalis]|nr:hypothetical protein MXB_1945 [Myxobolus squamalis]